MENGVLVKYNETILKCCDGYITVKQQCKPYCSNCSNGTCLSPNHCQCHVGYIWNRNTGSCELICHCENGYCSTPSGQCVCSDGYRKSKLSANQCEPICEPECPKFSMCTKPQNCECFRGYEYNAQTLECELKCDDRYFRPDFRIDGCVLKNCSCTSENGYCLLDYNECNCYNGFHQTSNNQCEPVCEKQCENSECLGANYCECWQGYHYRTNNSYICEPDNLCNGQLCENGECLETGNCRCNKGFRKSFTFKGQLVCETTSVFIGKIMSLIVAVPTALALIALLIVYIVAKRRN